MTCPSCEKTTCTTCKSAAHTGDCLDDTALQQLLDTAGNEQWQRCYKCHHLVELEQGCKHITFVSLNVTMISLYWPCVDVLTMLNSATSAACNGRRVFAHSGRNQDCMRELNRSFSVKSVLVDDCSSRNVRVARPQPRSRRPSLAGNTLRLNAMLRPPSPESAWESDFSDHSE